jgi:hypothetical protein
VDWGLAGTRLVLGGERVGVQAESLGDDYCEGDRVFCFERGECFLSGKYMCLLGVEQLIGRRCKKIQACQTMSSWIVFEKRTRD